MGAHAVLVVPFEPLSSHGAARHHQFSPACAADLDWVRFGIQGATRRRCGGAEGEEGRGGGAETPPSHGWTRSRLHGQTGDVDKSAGGPGGSPSCRQDAVSRYDTTSAERTPSDLTLMPRRAHAQHAAAGARAAAQHNRLQGGRCWVTAPQQRSLAQVAFCFWRSTRQDIHASCLVTPTLGSSPWTPTRVRGTGIADGWLWFQGPWGPGQGRRRVRDRPDRSSSDLFACTWVQGGGHHTQGDRSMQIPS